MPWLCQPSYKEAIPAAPQASHAFYLLCERLSGTFSALEGLSKPSLKSVSNHEPEASLAELAKWIVKFDSQKLHYGLPFAACAHRD